MDALAVIARKHNRRTVPNVNRCSERRPLKGWVGKRVWPTPSKPRDFDTALCQRREALSLFVTRSNGDLVSFGVNSSIGQLS